MRQDLPALGFRAKLLEAGTDAPVHAIGGAHWLRLSAFAYNELEDYARLTDIVPITRYVAVRENRTRMTVETRVSRSVRPADYGFTDRRELGLLVDWDFVTAPR